MPMKYAETMNLLFLAIIYLPILYGASLLGFMGAIL
jgi:hypothetical protein